MRGKVSQYYLDRKRIDQAYFQTAKHWSFLWYISIFWLPKFIVSQHHLPATKGCFHDLQATLSGDGNF